MKTSIKLHNFLIGLLIGLIIISCEDGNPVPVIDVNLTAGINLRNPKVGDQASYILYQSQCADNFRYTGDTLNVEIVSKNDSLFLRESYSNSSSREGTSEHLIIKGDEYVLIPQRNNSQFLFFYGNDTIFLDKQASLKLEQDGCMLFSDQGQFIGNEIGLINEFQFGQFRISNQKSISCVPGGFDLDAYILYEDHLNLIHIVQNGGLDIVGFMAIN